MGITQHASQTTPLTLEKDESINRLIHKSIAESIDQPPNQYYIFTKAPSLLLITLVFTFVIALLSGGCASQISNTGGSSTASALGTLTPTTSASASAVASGPNAVTIALRTGSSGSFDAASVAATGGTYSKVARSFDLNGNLIVTSGYQNWWFDPANSGVYLTSTSTSYPGGGSGATASSSANKQVTPCAYFDSYDDNNPEANGSYTIDGIIPNASSYTTSSVADIDQCAGITAGEKANLGMYFTIKRGSANMNSTDKLQIMIRARSLTPPNIAPVPSSCVVGGLLDPTACASTVFTVSMRTALGAAARPFFMFMPSAKSLDLISESILLPINIDPALTVITIDRLKGGAVFYDVKLVRIP